MMNFGLFEAPQAAFSYLEYTEHSLGKEEHPRRVPSTSALGTGRARRVPAAFRGFGSSSKVRVTSQDLTMATLCSQGESHTDGARTRQSSAPVRAGLDQQLRGQTPGKARCDAWLGSHQQLVHS